MTSAMNTIIYPVRDLAQARVRFGALLGVAPTMDEPYYVQYDVGDQEVGLDPHGHSKGMTGPVCYFSVDDIKDAVAQLLDAGAQMQHDVNDVGGGKLIATVQDADGNVIGLIQAPRS